MIFDLKSLNKLQLVNSTLRSLQTQSECATDVEANQ